MSHQLVLVTGGGGFIGSNIACMLSHDHDVVICDLFAHEVSWKYLARAPIHDALRPEEALAWLDRHQRAVCAVVHMGAVSSTTETDLRKIVASNIRLTLDLWERCAKYDIAFVYASSAATYGDGSQGFVDDDAPEALARLAPLNAYGWSKHAVDRRITRDVARGRPAPSRWAGLKFFNVYGPNEGHKGEMRSLVHRIYPTAAQGGTVSLFKSGDPAYVDGGQLRDFVYVKDCCAVVRKILEASSVAGIFNVGTGRARTFEELARAVFRAVGQPVRISYDEMPDKLRGQFQYHTRADLTKLVAAGLAPQFHELEAGVADYVSEHLVTELGGSHTAAAS
jgi:ADP-L-glycero-D-manno-heptose 6-epimerase